MTDNLRGLIARNLGHNYGLADDGYSQDDLLRMADGLITAIDRDYIIVQPGTPLAQKIVEWQWENNG